MIPRQTLESKFTFSFMTGFHLGLPLAICQTRRSSTGWEAIQKELEREFSRRSDRFEIIFPDYDSETKFPLGKPFVLRHRKFFEIFDVPKLLSEAGITLPAGRYALDDLIWICATGAVLVSCAVSLDDENTTRKIRREIASSDRSDFVEKHYAELTLVFSELAEIILGLFPAKLLESALACGNDLQKYKQSFQIRRGFLGAGQPTVVINDARVAQLLHDNAEARTLYEDILIDVYYIDFRRRQRGRRLKIGYVSSIVETSDPEYLLVIGVVYSSFVGLLWLQKHLGEQLQVLQEGLIGASRLRDETAFELRLFRIFCLKFISESSPISIRLTHIYMAHLEECWKEYRMQHLVDQVYSQLATLEKMFDSLDEVQKEARNRKLGISAVLLAALSLMAVAAELISVFDLNNHWDLKLRVILVGAGFAIGVLSTLGIYYLFPISKRSPWLRAIRRRRGW